MYRFVKYRTTTAETKEKIAQLFTRYRKTKERVFDYTFSSNLI